MGRVARQTVDLSAFPDLVVIYLGMGVNGWVGIKRLPRSADQEFRNQKPDGLLLHENFLACVNIGAPLIRRIGNGGEDFLRSSGGTGFWHEAYFMRGGMEAIYDDIPAALASDNSRPSGPPVGRCFRPGIAPG